MPVSKLQSPVAPRAFFVDKKPARRVTITGVTRDENGDPLGNCVVHIFEKQYPKVLRQVLVSDAEGNYTVEVTEGLEHQIVAGNSQGSAKQFWYHTETTLRGAPTAPTGCATLSTLFPDLTSNEAGGHMNHSAEGGTGEFSQINKPFAQEDVGVSGPPPVTHSILPEHQFGWFSDEKYSGTFALGEWFARFRSDDDADQTTGRPIINLYACTSRDFTVTRFVGQLRGFADWWQGAATVSLNGSSGPVGPFAFVDEYLFLQLWCNETGSVTTGSTLDFHQEGSELENNLESTLISAPFLESTQTPVAGVTLETLIGTPASDD